MIEFQAKIVALVAAVAYLMLVAACGGGDASSSPSTVTVTDITTVTSPSENQAPDAEEATNLVVTDEIRHELWLAEVQNPTSAEAKATKGPLPGSTYYGEYQGIRYAVASFDLPAVDTANQPTLFVQLPGAPWARVDHIGVAPRDEATGIPCPLREIWDFGCAEES